MFMLSWKVVGALSSSASLLLIFPPLLILPVNCRLLVIRMALWRSSMYDGASPRGVQLLSGKKFSVKITEIGR